MAQVRNISADARLLADRPVDVDELVTVDDAAFLDRAWPAAIWKLVTPPSSGFDASPADAILWTSTPPEEPAPEPAAGDAPAPQAPADTNSASDQGAASSDGTE